MNTLKTIIVCIWMIAVLIPFFVFGTINRLLPWPKGTSS